MPDKPQERAHPSITITTDGAARGNPGPGGWAALLQFTNGENVIEKLVVGQETSTTTNNAMEIEAVIGGLAALKRPCRVHLRIDSIYVINGIERLRSGRPFQVGAKNDERWTRLADAMRTHDISYEWIKGHAGDSRNEQVDAAATEAAMQAYEASERLQHSERADAPNGWLLALCSPGSNRPVRWTLHTDRGVWQGDVQVGDLTEPTAMWQGLIDALRCAQKVAAGEAVDVTIRTNFELLVKQGRGEWKVKQAAHQPFAAQLGILRTKLGRLYFEFATTEEVRETLNVSR